MKKFVLTVLALAMTADVASAGLFASFIRKGPISSPIVNTIEDRDVEYITKGVGNLDNTKFEAGDSVTLYMEMASISSSDGFFTATPLNASLPQAGGPGYEMLAKGVFTIDSIGPVVGGKATFDFSGSIDFVENLSGLTFNFNAGIAATDAVFLNALNSPLMTIGTKAGSNDFITAVGAPVAFIDIPTFGTAVDADFGLSLLAGGVDLGLVENALEGNINGVDTGTFHTFTGSTQAFSLLDPTNLIGDDKFDLRTNTDVNMANVVPEPGSMIVFAGGLALCGLRLRSRKVS
jgi:hypothetical protein